MCHVPSFTPQQFEHFHTASRRAFAHEKQTIEKRLQELWAEPPFRKQLKEAHTLYREECKAHRTYKDEEEQLRQEYQTAIRPSVDLIRAYKKIFIKRHKELTTRRPFLRARSTYSRYMLEFLETHGLRYGDFSSHMTLPKRFPRLPLPTFLFQHKPWHLFRVPRI
jgi:hypothetical protein